MRDIRSKFHAIILALNIGFERVDFGYINFNPVLIEEYFAAPGNDTALLIDPNGRINATIFRLIVSLNKSQ